jgi:hypothetical protein
MVKRRGIPNTACYKQVEIDGTIYKSVSEACTALSICSTTLKKRIKNGNGKYL